MKINSGINVKSFKFVVLLVESRTSVVDYNVYKYEAFNGSLGPQFVSNFGVGSQYGNVVGGQRCMYGVKSLNLLYNTQSTSPTNFLFRITPNGATVSDIVASEAERVRL
mgnify:CR=1 FL=1